MPSFSLIRHVTAAADLTQSRITDLAFGPGATTLYATTRFDGSISAWDTGGSGLTQTASQGHLSGAQAGSLPGLTFVGAALLSGGGTGGQMALYSLAGAGGLGTASPLGATSTFAGTLVQPVTVSLSSGNTMVYGGIGGGGSGLARMTFSATGTLTATAITPDTGAVFAKGITALGQAKVGGSDFLLTSSATEVGVTAWQVASNGAPVARGSLAAADGFWAAAPSAIVTTTVAGQTYAIVAGAGSGSLSVMALGVDGSLSMADHIIDDRNSRFAGVQALETVTHDGQAYVIAGGSDDGISVYTVLPGGGLLARGHFADTPDMSLANVSAIAARSAGTGIDIFVASATEAGLTRLRWEIGATGTTLTAAPTGGALSGVAGADLLIGGAGADVVSGGAGDDILTDGAGSDTLTGGAGADVFVMAADNSPDFVTDFQVGLDRLDLGAWPSLRSIYQLFLTPTADGITITYGGETLTLRNATGQPIAATDLSDSDILGQARLPESVAPGFSGPIRTPPALPARPVIPDPVPQPLPGPDGLELIGTARADTLRGAEGADLLWGQPGADVLFGGAGADMLFGGAGADDLHGEAGDDMLYGGSGRNGAWTATSGTRADDNGDRLLGGAGNDRLFGQAGHDVLDGGTGDDVLTGGAGRDSFVFNAGADVITDFQPMLDRIALDAALWSGALDGAGVVSRFGSTDGTTVTLDFGGGAQLQIQNHGDLTGLGAMIDIV